MYAKPFGYCDLHEREVWEQEFERKGCWNCYHFYYSEDCPYADVAIGSKSIKESICHSAVKNSCKISFQITISYRLSYFPVI